MKSKNGRPFFMVCHFFAQELGLRGVAKVSLREMMRLTGLTKQSIINAIKALQEAGLIEKTSSATKKSAYKILCIEISPDGKPVKIFWMTLVANQRTASYTAPHTTPSLK